MPKFQKFSLSILLAVFVFITIAGSLSYTQPAKALFGVSDTVIVIEDLSQRLLTTKNIIKEAIKNAVINIAVQSFAYFLRRTAYDTAVWLASGGKGEQPFAHYKDFGSYMKDVGDHAAGVAIDALGAPYGLNLCKIPDPKIDLAMRIGLTYKFMDLNQQQGVLQPNCTWSSFQKDVLSASNWQSQYGSGADIARKFNVAFSVEQSDLGILLSATEKIDNLVARQTEADKLQRQEGDGYKPKTTLISGDIVTPAKNIAEEARAQNPSEQRKAAEAGFLATLGTGAINSIAGAGSLFLNTLASQMLKNFQTKGMLPFGICVGNSGDEECRNKLVDVLNSFEGQTSPGGRQAAQTLFADLLTPPNIQIDQYNVLGNFSSCPATSPGPENCVADDGLTQAAQETSVGKPITIVEALAKNWLHGEWKLISPERAADQTDTSCYQRAYCYANIAKLRKARVLPLGFEIAALNSNPDTPWTLKQVVAGFNDCNFVKDINGKVVGVNNDPVNKPFCHLIDPNWVLKAPASKCNFVAFGSTPYFSGTPNRATECVDLSTCVAYDKDGNCATQGYCTREKNVWKIDAAKCDPQYRTCQSFKDSAGKNVSYLYRTLDTGYCTQDNVGCAEYSLKQDNTGNWADYSKDDLNIIGENSAIFFNSKISTNCSANSDGCSSFQTASTSDKLYLRQAPYYLGCYDTNTSTLAVDRPQTISDLNKLTQNPKCNNYSAPCIADEVNCNWYAPISYAGDSIPGKFTPAAIVENQVVWNDQCDKRCVGYAAYREMPSNYSGGTALAYVIPSSGSNCNAVDEGCASFTNLSTTEGGLEKVEHYSYLRPCILPDVAKQKNFYTYEGSVVGGYQLKGFILEKNADGSPKYFYTTSADLTVYDSVCSESLYKSGATSPDCRQFNDEQGTVYYKLLSKTIAVSGSCTPYRLNDTELAAPATCFQNGEYRDGQCFYYGLPNGVQNTAGTSKSCAPQVNTCRAYKGNAGNNVRNVFSDNFEDSSTTLALADWGPTGSIIQSLESTHAGEHSLAYNGALATYKNLSLNPGRSYDLTFWAKGSAGATVSVTLENDSVSTLGAISVGDVWQYYHLGPAELGGVNTSTQLKFSISGQLFLDNVRLKEVADYIYLVKNTLKVDPVCDSNLNDNLPGEALGCSEYKTPQNKPIYLTKFTALCREKAIGCTSLYDTRNTPDESGPRAYNVWLAGAEGANVTRNIGGNNYNCQIPLGRLGCYVDVIGATVSVIIADGGIIVTSTIYIKPDTPSSIPIYLVANQQATCSAADLGCAKAGRLASTPAGPSYGDVLVKNDPASYNTTLCQNEAVGCNGYSSANGALYFKDPNIIGQKICSYREDVSIGGINYNGWFWKSAGKCGPSGSYCSSNSDCVSGVTCDGVDEQPCYPTYLQTGNNYGLWSYGVSGSYNNFVGECPAAQNGCTEFIDRNENNKTHYLINDDRLKARQNDCNGQISEKFGCILFDKTDSPNKLWNTAQSYAASAQLDSKLVAPVASTSNDANIILKVDRDRECGEWLQCRSSHRIFDSQSGNYKEICDAIGRCDKSPESATKNDITNCANWVGSQELANQVLTDDAYRSRSTDWLGQEFSGYSIFNYYPVDELSEINFGNNGNPQWRLAKKVPCGGGVNCKSTVNIGSFDCLRSGEPCGRGRAGICVNGACLQNPDGSTANVAKQSIGQSCRAYPEEISPFPNTDLVGKSPLYASANLCNESIGFTTDKLRAMGCDCDYTKISYGDIFTKYWNFNKPNEGEGLLNKNSSAVKGIVGGICSGGANADRVCGTDDDCAGGSCQKLGKQTRLVGWHGYCIEPDISRPLNAEPNNFACLTWFPIDTIMGAPDINSQHVEAGFQASSAGGKYYCLGAKGNQQTHITAPTNDYNQFLATQTIKHCGAEAGCTGGGDRTTDREKRVVLTPAIPVFQEEIDYIKIVANGSDGNWFPKGVGTFYIRNDLKTRYNGPQWSIDGKDLFPPPQKLPNETINMGFGRYIYSDGTNKDAWVMFYDDGDGDGDDQFQFADPGGQDIPLAPFRNLLASRIAGSTGCDSVGTVAGSDSYQNDCLGGDMDNRDDGCAIRVNFVNGQLGTINVICYTGDGVDKEEASFDIYVGLRESCVNIAQTEAVPYTAVGLTDHLWSNGKYVVDFNSSPSNLNYPYALLSQPFGSLGMSSLAPQQPVNIFSHYDKTTFDPPPAIVGASYSCSGRNCLEFRTTTLTLDETVPGSASGEGLVQGKTFLGGIFAKIESVWNWNNFGSYAQNTTTVDSYSGAGEPYNMTENSTNFNNAPKIHPLGACKTGGKCLETNSNGFTLNGKSAGDVVFLNSVAPVNIKFYAFADKNQMPIRKMQVDWGDSNKVALDGYFRNQRGAVNGACGPANTCLVSSTVWDVTSQGYRDISFDTKQSCASSGDCRYLDNCFSESLAPNFGQIAGETCDNGYARFDHVYQCSRDGAGWTTSCPDSDIQSLNGGCCVYQPKVQVKDNWGWCNGTCPNPFLSSPGGAGCYDKSWTTKDSDPTNDAVDECFEMSGGSYTGFAGRIIVAPQ
ncbi:MAG: hypothetical protein AAB797_02190 [Patescibacteria group bacterium]